MICTMPSMSNHIIIIAGESSGDLHAAHLVDELKKIDPSLSFSGLGGKHMQHSGVILYEDITRLAVVGFVEILKHYHEFKRIFNMVLHKCVEQKPRAVILVDYPGFNLRLAQELKKQDIPVIYYISPQIWAWKEKRINIIKKYTDRLLVLFKFEKEFYAQRGLDVDFVGHPFIDTVNVTKARDEILKNLNLTAEKITIGLLPGSRQREVEIMLPIMIDAASLLSQKYPNIQFLLIKAPTIPHALIEEYVMHTSTPIVIGKNNIYDNISACDVCMVTSGTATLETALLGKPMVVIYRTSFFTWLLARALVKIPNIGLVNVVAGDRIVPECVQYHANGGNIAAEMEKMFTDEIVLADIKKKLKKVKESLGASGASHRAAQKIITLISNPPNLPAS